MTALHHNSSASVSRYGKDTTPSLLHAISNISSARPDAIAIQRFQSGASDPVESFSYGELWNTASVLAASLQCRAEPGDSILLQAADSFEHIAWLLASLAAGLYVCPFDPALPAAALNRLALETSARLAVTAAPCSVLDHMPQMDSHLARQSSPIRTGKSLSTGGGIILQSSGTTGTPKLVARSTASLSADAFQTKTALALCESDRVAGVVPLCHSYGTDLLVASLFSGAAFCILDIFDHASLAGMLTDHVTVFPGIPFLFESLVRSPPRASDRMPLHLAFSAGAPLPLKIQEAMHSTWRVPIGQLYGMTELGAVTFNDPSSSEFDPTSVGLPMHNVEIRILDSANPPSLLAPNHEGQIAIRAGSMLSHYLPREAPQLTDGFFLTGDLGRLDSRGRLYITGRSKLMIDIGGRKVNPIEVETALATHPLVDQCAVIGVAASETVTRLHALVVAKDPDNPPRDADLRRHLKVILAAYKTPRAFEIVRSLPRSPMGKLLRSQLAPGATEL